MQTTITHDSQTDAMLKGMSREKKQFLAGLAAGSASMSMALGLPTTITTYISGQRERMDMGGLTLLYDGRTGQAFGLDRTQKVYAPAPADQIRKEINAAGEKMQSQMEATKGRLHLKDMGHSQVIGGRLSRQYLLTNAPGQEAEGMVYVWIAPEMPKIAGDPREQNAARIALSPYAEHPGLITLLTATITDKKEGTIQIRLTSNLSTAPIPDSVFAIPAGYKEQKQETTEKPPAPYPAVPAPPHNHLNNALMQAIDDDDEAAVQKSLTQGASLKAQDDTGFSTLTLACQHGYLNIVKALVAKGADVNAQDDVGNTPLTIASLLGNTEVVRFLLDQGAKVNAKVGSSGTTALCEAAFSGEDETAALLLDRGADVNQIGLLDAPPLAIAACQGQSDTMKLLLARGARTEGDDYGLKALSLAASEKRLPAVQFLLDRGISPNPQADGVRTPLREAAQNGDLTMIKLLLSKGARTDAKDKDGVTALMYAALSKNPACVAELLAADADVNAKVTGTEAWLGATALMYAAREGQAEMVKMLLAKGADVHARTGEGETALTAAEGNPAVVALLKAAGEKQ